MLIIAECYLILYRIQTCHRRKSTSSISDVVSAADGVEYNRRLSDREPAVRVSYNTYIYSLSYQPTRRAAAEAAGRDVRAISLLVRSSRG
jgi:hypothetical protein